MTIDLDLDDCAYVGFVDRAGSWYADGERRTSRFGRGQAYDDVNGHGQTDGKSLGKRDGLRKIRWKVER